MKHQNFSIQVGDDLDLVIVVRQSDGCTVLDVTGTTALWVLARSPGATPLVSKTGALSDPTIGEVTVSLVPADTEDLCAGRYHHELQLTDANDRVTTVMTGVARIMGDSAP
jgi:hypothetical protein